VGEVRELGARLSHIFYKEHWEFREGNPVSNGACAFAVRTWMGRLVDVKVGVSTVFGSPFGDVAWIVCNPPVSVSVPPSRGVMVKGMLFGVVIHKIVSFPIDDL
jgi:hypothetical protein